MDDGEVMPMQISDDEEDINEGFVSHARPSKKEKKQGEHGASEEQMRLKEVDRQKREVTDSKVVKEESTSNVLCHNMAASVASRRPERMKGFCLR
jgi:hypothetical protein